MDWCSRNACAGTRVRSTSPTMHDGIVWRLSPEGQTRKVLELATSPGGLGSLPDGTLQVVSMLDGHLLRLTPKGLVTITDLSLTLRLLARKGM